MTLTFRRFTTTTTAALLLLTASATLAGADPDSLTLSHTYKASGTNPDGSAYEGNVTIDVISTTTFSIKWTIGDETYKGFGMRRNDALAATYTINGSPGLVIYQVQGNGLDGIWSIRGKDGSGTERLTPTD